MPKSNNMGANKIYKPNPKPVKDPDFSATGWDKNPDMADNRDLAYPKDVIPSDEKEPNS